MRLGIVLKYIAVCSCLLYRYPLGLGPITLYVAAHPDVKAFITHGGPRSLEEAMFYEVPIVGLPLVKSRKVFIEQVTKRGAGLVLDPYYLDKDTVKNAITAVVTNPK